VGSEDDSAREVPEVLWTLRLVTLSPKTSWSLLERCFLGKRHAALIRAIHKGVSPDVRDDCGATLLMHACGAGDIATCFILLSLGANVRLQNKELEHALGYLCAYNDGDDDARATIACTLVVHYGRRGKVMISECRLMARRIGLVKVAKVLSEHLKQISRVLPARE